jgi:hypothetical protein
MEYFILQNMTKRDTLTILLCSEVAMKLTFFLVGALFSAVQYFLAKKVFFKDKAQLGAIYILQRLILSLLLLVAVMMVSPDSLIYTAIGLIAAAVLLPVVFNRKR